jgi:hypothetical protein
MVEPLTEHCTFPECGFDLALLRQNLAIGAFDGPTPADKAFVHVSAHLLATIDALLSQLREQRERAERAEKDRDYWRDDICETWMERADAAERTVREQREVIEAAKRLRALHVKRDQMIDNDTWESEGAIPTYTAIANAESKLSTALAALPPVADERTEPA